MWSSLGMLVAAFLPPAPRVLGFAAGILIIIAFHYQKIMTANLVAQLALYLTGGISFLRSVCPFWALLLRLQSRLGINESNSTELDWILRR